MDTLVLIVIVALLATLAGVIWFSGKENPIKSGASRSSRAKAFRASLPQLREIASRHQRHPVGHQAQIFLFEWNRIRNEIQRMGRDQRERRLADLYYARVQPILEAYENLKRERSSK